MNFMQSFQVWLSLLLIVRALVVRVAQERETNLADLSLLPRQSSLLNETSLSPGILSNTRPTVYCDGDQYGKDLILADCRDAITAIQPTRQEVRFGERTAAKATWDIGLPYRTIGSEDTAKDPL